MAVGKDGLSDPPGQELRPKQGIVAVRPLSPSIKSIGPGPPLKPPIKPSQVSHQKPLPWVIHKRKQFMAVQNPVAVNGQVVLDDPRRQEVQVRSQKLMVPLREKILLLIPPKVPVSCENIPRPGHEAIIGIPVVDYPVFLRGAARPPVDIIVFNGKERVILLAVPAMLVTDYGVNFGQSDRLQIYISRIHICFAPVGE
jgi:hypothetical protein